mgnify:CR=1 FL=1
MSGLRVEIGGVDVSDKIVSFKILTVPPKSLGPYLTPIDTACCRCERFIEAGDTMFIVWMQKMNLPLLEWRGECMGCAEGRGFVCPEHPAYELRDCAICAADERADR